MEKIVVYNNRTLEALEKEFNTKAEADAYEILLEFLGSDYDRYSDGELVYTRITWH